MEVMTFEEHSSVLPEWWIRGPAARTVVYLDAHLDLQPINPQRLARLGACTSKEQVKALEKPHHLLPDRGTAYSLEDWLYPAHRLGLFEHLVWVAPPHVSVGFTEAVFAHLQQMDGVRPSELAGFRRLPSGAFSGTLVEVKITICSLGQLAALGLTEPLLVDIDTDYFIEVPGDRVWTDPRAVFDAVQRLAAKPDGVSISRSAGSGFLPVRYRYFTDYLAALWEQRGEDAEHYARLFALDERLSRGAAPDAAALAALEAESARYPECAATWYLRALSASDRDASQLHRERAARLSEGYRPHLLTRACSYPHRRLPLGEQTYRELERQLAAEAMSASQRAAAQAALGVLLCAAGRIDAAIGKYRQCIASLGSHPGLALEIGKAYVARDRAVDAVPFLQAALDDDKSRTLAQVYLAEHLRGSGDFERALGFARAAHEAAPAWGEVMLLAADLHRRAGQAAAADALLEQHRWQERQLGALLRQGAGAASGLAPG